MKSDEIRQFCLSLPHVSEKLQWGDALCFKIAGKMFAVLGLDNPRLSFKCSPDIFAELIEREDVGPSPYLGRHKWVRIENLDALGNDELRELIRQSYRMVSPRAPRGGERVKASGRSKQNRVRSAARKKSARKRN